MLTWDHLTIGGNQSAAIVFAAIVALAVEDGPGDTEWLPVTIPDLQKAMGALSYGRETVSGALDTLVKRGAIVEGPRAQNNIRRIRIDWRRVNELMDAEGGSL